MSLEYMYGYCCRGVMLQGNNNRLLNNLEKKLSCPAHFPCFGVTPILFMLSVRGKISRLRWQDD